MATEGWR